MKILLFFLVVATLWGNPSGLDVVSGTCTFEQQGKHLHLQTSDGAILHWKDFSILPGEMTQFHQPNGEAWVLNQVTGTLRSEIHGALLSNGQIVLLNPNGILFGKDSYVEVGGLIASSLKEVLVDGKVTANHGALAFIGSEVIVGGSILSKVGKYTYVRAEDNPYGITIKDVGGRVYLWSENETRVKPSGILEGETLALLSEGEAHFQGTASVKDIEISGKKGFYHTGTFHRRGMLTLDPESDVTISTIPSYNYEGNPTSDFSNITICKLIEEIEAGPVTITTYFDGKGGGLGSITVKGDVQHTFHSPHPLIFQTEGAGGIHLEGALTNTGCGPIQLSAPHITITGKLMGQDLNIQGGLTCHGELYGKNLTVLAKGDGEISGKVITDGGHCYWKGGKTLRLTGEWGHLGGGRFHLEGMRNLFIEEGGHLYATNRTTCFTIQNLGGIFSIEKGRVSAGSAPLYISGDCGAVSLEGGLLESMAPITIDVGHHCHLCQSHLTSPQSIHLTLGEDLLLMEGSSLSSPQGIQVNAKERVTLFDTSSISGRGVTINCGETLSLFESATIKGGSSPLFASAGEMLHLEGPQVRIEGGQVSLHAGESFSMEGRSQIASTLGNLSVTAGTTAQLGQEAKISAYGGDLEFIVNEGNLYLYGESALLSPTHGSQIIIGKSLIMEDFSQIQNHGEKGTTIIVDHLGRDGGIVMGPHTSISTGHSPLQIFSAKRHLNTLNGMLNGYRFSPSLLYLNTEYEQWGVSYPSPSSSALFTLFHKENGLITIHPNQHVNQTDFRQILINYIGPFTAELQRDLHPYDEFTSQSITFTNEDEPYFIRRRNEQKDDMD